MGYRSDVAIRIIGPRDRMLAELSGLLLVGDHYMREALDEFTVMPLHTDEAVLALNYESWKWYSGYEDVQAFEKIWSHFHEIVDDEGNGIFCGAFLRIGENDDDVEQRSFGEGSWDLIRFSRTFECEHVLDPTKDLRNNRSSTVDTQTT